MGWKIGLPSLKLNNAGVKSKSCGDFGHVAAEALKERKGHDPDIDPERAALNRYEGFETAAALQKYSREHVEQLRDAKGRKLRSDAVVMCATVLKPPAAYMATLSHEDQLRMLDDAYEAFAEIVGEDNIKSRADHFDEQGGHTHVFWEPMTADGRLCAKEVHNLKFFRRVNQELPAKLRERGWDIDDCEMYDAAQQEYEETKKTAGRSSYAYKAEAEKAKLALEAEIAVLQKQADKLREVNTAHEDIINSKADTLHLISTLAEYEAEAEALSKTLDMLEAAQKGMPTAAKLFRGEEASAWQTHMRDALDGLRDVVEAEIIRLQIYEQTNETQERHSEQAQKRMVALDEQISGADKRREEGRQQAEYWRRYRQIRDNTWQTFISAQRAEFEHLRLLRDDLNSLYRVNSTCVRGPDGKIIEQKLHSREELERDGFYDERARILEEQKKHRHQLATVREYERIARERQAIVRARLLDGADQEAVAAAMGAYQTAMRDLQKHAADPDYDFEGRRLKAAQWSLEQAKKREALRAARQAEGQEQEQSALMEIADEEYSEFQTNDGNVNERDVAAALQEEQERDDGGR